jgi:acetyl-CoA acetyltransferase family protein
VSRRVAPIAVDVLSAVRTPVGRHRGALSHVRVDDLAALVIREAVERAGVAGADVDEVFAGCVNASGEAMGNLARHAARLAGLPVEVPGVTLNRWCGSGLSALAAGAQQIAVGAADVVVVAGAESMSRSTWPVPMPDRAFAGGRLVARDAMWSGGGGPQHPDLEASGDMVEMPQTAQELVRRFGLAREELDAWALRSHQLAAAAQHAGAFDAEIIAVPGADGQPVVADETVRRQTTAERLAALRPYLADCPDITAGNASPINDGASALVLAAPSVSARLGRRPLARLSGVASAGVDPAVMGLGAAAAARRLPCAVTDADVVEINEAFASVALACTRDLELDPARVNPLGGALALGHALGNSGTRLATTLVHHLDRRGAGTGVVAICVGGGQGVAAQLEAVA